MRINIQKVQFVIVFISTFFGNLKCDGNFLSCDRNTVNTCQVVTNPFVSTSNTFIEKVLKNGETLKKSVLDDFTRLKIDNVVMKYFPSQIEIFFENIENIDIVSTGLIQINSLDLKPFVKLTRIEISQNPIEEIPKDIFKFNLNLKEVKLFKNKIKFIHPKVFSKLPHLQNVFLTCFEDEKNKFFISREKVLIGIESHLEKYFMKAEYKEEQKSDEILKVFNKLKKETENMQKKVDLELKQIQPMSENLKKNQNELQKVFESVQKSLKEKIKFVEKFTEELEKNFNEKKIEKILLKLNFEEINEENLTTNDSIFFNNDSTTMDYIYIAICATQTFLIIFLITFGVKFLKNGKHENIYSDFNSISYENPAFENVQKNLNNFEDVQYESPSELGITQMHDIVEYEPIEFDANGDDKNMPIYSEVNKELKRMTSFNP